MGEPGTLGVLPTELLALLRCVGVSVVVDDVVLREVTGPFHKVPAHRSLVHRGGERRGKQEDEDRDRDAKSNKKIAEIRFWPKKLAPKKWPKNDPK